MKFSWALGAVVVLRCIHWEWTLRDELFSVVCSVEDFCDGLYMLQALHASLMKGSSYTHQVKKTHELGDIYFCE